MNVRFSEQAVRCRVKREEFEQLLSGRALTLNVALPGAHAFRTSVRPHALDEWRLDSDPTGFWLSIPRTELTNLAEMLPSKEGLSHTFITNGDDLEVSFEVDVKKPRPAPTQ